MLAYALTVIFLLITVDVLIARKTYFYLPFKELKRQAEAGEPLAKVLYRAVAYRASLKALLWLLIGLFGAAGVVALVQAVPQWLSFIVIVALLWLALAWLPSTRVTGFDARLTVWTTPYIVRLLRFLAPLFERLGSLAKHYYPADLHTGLYQREDLLDLLSRQQNQEDSRMSDEELHLLEEALQFDTRTVNDALLPRQQVADVSADEAVGPVLLDELHKTGFASFPVHKGKKDNFVGMLLLRKLSVKSTGHVRDYMEPEVFYLHQNDSLSEALRAFYATKNQLFVVVNSFDEYVGILTIEDVLRRLLGSPEANDDEDYTDRKKIAARHEPPPKPKKGNKTDKKIPEIPTEVLE